MSEENQSAGFDLFELVVAIILGLGALGGALAGYQGGLWGGSQDTSFSQASNTMTLMSTTMTVAAAEYNEAVQTATRDANIDLQAKQLYVEIITSTDELIKEKNAVIVKYLYAKQLSPAAYKYLGLPPDLYDSDDFTKITFEQLEAAVDKEIGDKYFDEIEAPAEKKWEEALNHEKKARETFLQGRKENYNGDQMSFAGVLFTVVLFLAGIGLVFKSKVRWVFGGLGGLMLLVSWIFLFTLEWTASSKPPDQVTEPSALEGDDAAPDASGDAPAPAGEAPKEEGDDKGEE